MTLTAPNTYTARDLELAVRRQAGADPDRVYYMSGPYSKCVYEPTPNNPKGCIVGAALRSLGEPITGGEDVTTLLYETSILKCFLSKDKHLKSAAFLHDVQMNQDSGYAWAEAISEATQGG